MFEIVVNCFILKATKCSGYAKTQHKKKLLALARKQLRLFLFMAIIIYIVFTTDVLY
jgi:hypothetical protein